MSRRGNCHDNAVAESYFQLPKRERAMQKIYATRDDARSEIFDYIEMFYNPKRRRSQANALSPVQYERVFPEAANRLGNPGGFRVQFQQKQRLSLNTFSVASPPAAWKPYLQT